jgi:hypothetical protein
MLKNKLIVAIALLICVVALGIGSTVAFLTRLVGPLDNTFIIGDIDMTLEETAGNQYQLIPGNTYKKDPTVTVKSGSVDCWIFVEITKTANPDAYLDYSVAESWFPLTGHSGVYYRSVSEITEDVSFEVLSGNMITVKETLTKEVMQGITVTPKLTFTAYAIQSLGLETAAAAYNEILFAKGD